MWEQSRHVNDNLINFLLIEHKDLTKFLEIINEETRYSVVYIERIIREKLTRIE